MEATLTTDILFYLFSAAILGCGLMAVTVKNLLHSAIALMGCLFGTAGLFLLLDHEFVALMQILVYIGGVVIFIIYAVLLTTHLGTRYLPASTLKYISGVTLAAIVLGLVLHIDPQATHTAVNPDRTATTIDAIGYRLLDGSTNGFLIPFEVISVLLLSAMIGAATIAKHQKPGATNDEDETGGSAS